MARRLLSYCTNEKIWMFVTGNIIDWGTAARFSVVRDGRYILRITVARQCPNP
jgi:hypothetical protein